LDFASLLGAELRLRSYPSEAIAWRLPASRLPLPEVCAEDSPATARQRGHRTLAPSQTLMT